jgi:tetratricopeptide (TPR) repeat protein
MTMRGRPEEGVAWLRRAIALNPFHPHWYASDLGYALYGLGHYDEAAEAFASAPELGVSYRMWLAASHAMAGRPGPAADTFEMVLRDVPLEALEQRADDWAEFEHKADLEHFRQGLRIAEQAFRDRPHGGGDGPKAAVRQT